MTKQTRDRIVVVSTVVIQLVLLTAALGASLEGDWTRFSAYMLVVTIFKLHGLEWRLQRLIEKRREGDRR